ncbi:NUDIX domain-containing protein [Croceibacterium sp. TMG7-5b_MA50]|uniref:NUDIX domain-containing protein n=1 Tax=Croceibacterium sp. TMG7-5b_MA50 TaxID=3121290 RepID=UPI00322210FA
MRPPAPLHRLALRVGHHLRVAWWRLRRPTIHGVSVIARDADGRVLLIRQTYGPRQWILPGGGVRHGEAPAAAAAREFAEELGCPLTGLTLVRVLEEPLHGATNVVHLFTGTLAGEPRADRREVATHRLFALDALPAVSARTQDRLALL